MKAFIKKEFLEQMKGNGIWVAAILLFMTSVFLLSEARGYPSGNALEAFFLNTFDLYVYIIPLLCLFLAAFSVYGEKENKTFQMIVTRKESYTSYFLKKSISLQVVLLIAFIMIYLLVIILATIILNKDIAHGWYFITSLLVLQIIFVQLGVFIGGITKSKMQMIGFLIGAWFLIIFIVDLIYIYFIPFVDYDNVHIFSLAYFLNPLHTVRLYLEAGLGIFDMSNLSSMMNRLIQVSPGVYLILNAVLWPIIFYLLTIFFKNDGEIND